MIWYKQENPDIVISTRVRLARNLQGIPFPERLQNKKEIIDKIKDAVFSSNSTLASDFNDLDINNLTVPQKQVIVDKHLMSRQMLKTEGDCLVNKDETMSIMIMEEDHIREQVILDGFKLEQAYEICNKVDDVLSESLNFAFDEKIGYLTACPTNTGTGLRVSVMLHLPGLSITGKMNRIVNSAANIGIAVRGYYGEGSQAEGYFYQISNQITMGIDEMEILERVKNVTNQIIAFEKESREELKKNNGNKLEDKLWRSYGTLKYARSLSSKEGISLLSDVLMGQNMEIITDKAKISPLELIVNMQPSIIGESVLTPEERDKKRAEYIRNNI